MRIDEQLKEAIGKAPSMYYVCKGAGVASPIMSRFMSGERGITLETAAKIAEFLGMVLVEANPQVQPRAAEKPARTQPAPKVRVDQKDVLTALRSVATGRAAKRGKNTSKRSR